MRVVVSDFFSDKMLLFAGSGRGGAAFQCRYRSKTSVLILKLLLDE